MKVLKDYLGRDVRLTDERLAHILRHPELAGMAGQIAATLEDPGEVRRSRTDASAELAYRYYTATIVGDKWLCVVSKYAEDDAFVLTAYLTDALKAGEKLWPEP